MVKKASATELAALDEQPITVVSGETNQPRVSDDEASAPAETVPLFQIPTAVQPQAVPEGAGLKHPALYFNQELSWLDFNWRVLHMAIDERTPLLERVRFVAITASNLDEFIQKRVGGLKRQEAAGVRKLTPDGRTPGEQLAALHDAVRTMHQTMTGVWEKTLKPALLAQAGIRFYDYHQLTPRQQSQMHRYFQNQIYPILTPLAVDPGHPFPFISNLSLSLAVSMYHPKHGTSHFARIKVPSERWLPVPADVVSNDGAGLVIGLLPVEQLIARHIEELFAGMEIESVHPFRITRNADLRRDEEEADDLLAMISAELRERRFAPVVRLEVDRAMPAGERRFLRQALDLNQDDVYDVDGLLGLVDLFAVANQDGPDRKFPGWSPVVPTPLAREGTTKETRDIFAIVRHGDLLVHHPYESFTASTQRLIEEAAADPQVLAIKQTLYRTSEESPIVRALMRAGESGKQVAVLVEVKARFDEANNIEWGQMLENSGVHVAYGLVGLKTHTKATLIVRRERDGLRTYCHIGTGNYNSRTARLYTDLGFFTCRPGIGQDIVNLFHFLTGYAPEQDYQHVLVAPNHMRSRFNELIDREIAFQETTGNGRIIAKMNALDDPRLIRRLYRASQAGVQIDLIIRGHCCLRPGIPDYGEHIRVVSILGRFLEHDRIYYFHNGGHPLTFIGSADWRKRNLKSRVELITPIEEPGLQQRLIQILEQALADNCLAWQLNPDGRYELGRPLTDQKKRDFQETLMREARRHSKKIRVSL